MVEIIQRSSFPRSVSTCMNVFVFGPCPLPFPPPHIHFMFNDPTFFAVLLPLVNETSQNGAGFGNGTGLGIGQV